MALNKIQRYIYSREITIPANGDFTQTLERFSWAGRLIQLIITEKDGATGLDRAAADCVVDQYMIAQEQLVKSARASVFPPETTFPIIFSTWFAANEEHSIKLRNLAGVGKTVTVHLVVERHNELKV